MPTAARATSLQTRPLAAADSRRTRLFQARSDKTIFVKANGTVPYGRVVEAMDVARGAGAERIGIVSDAAASSR